MFPHVWKMFLNILIGFAIANLVIILVLPPDFGNLLAPLQSVLYSVFTCRIILNIRGAGKNGGIQELHVGVAETSENMSRITFGLSFGDAHEELELPWSPRSPKSNRVA